MTMEVINRSIERVRLETRIRVLTVEAVVDITPHMRRIRLVGPELAGFQSPGHADHVKLFFSADGRPLPRPERTPDGIAWPDGTAKPFMRDYTPRYFDAAAQFLDLDFVLHGDGPASGWASAARPGDSLMVAGPRGSVVVPDAFDWHLLVGDETALPAIGRRIEELPAGRRVLAIIEVPEAGDRQDFATAADVEIVWIDRAGEAAGLANRLLPALAMAQFPAGVGFAFVAGEAEMARSLRAHLVARGFENEHIRAAGYWVRGEAGE